MKVPKPKPLAKQCDELWSKCIHARAKGRSELSGLRGPFHAHHIMHRPNYRLRFELENGILLTAYEHFFMAHGSRQEEFRDRIIAKIGQPKYDWLKSLRHGAQKTDLTLVKIYLKGKLKELSN